MQAMPFQLFPPPPPPGQYFPGFVPSQSSLPPLTIDEQPMQDKAMDMSVNEDAGSSFSTTASPAPSAMLSPQTSKLLQSAIESEGESIMALSPGTEHYPEEEEGAIQDRFTVSEIETNTEDLSRYEVSLHRVPTSSVEARASSTIPTNIQTDYDKVPLPPSYQNEDYSHFDLPSCQFANSTATVKIQNQDDSESDDDDSQTDDDEEDDDTESDSSSNPEDKDNEDMETTSNKSDSYELDMDEDIPRVDSPFTRIRPSLLKSFRESKNYQEKLQRKKTRKLELMSPLSPFEANSPKQVDQIPAAATSKQDIKIQTSEIESGVGESSSEEEESEPPTPYTPNNSSTAATPKPVGEAQKVADMQELEQVPSVHSSSKIVDERCVEEKDTAQEETDGDNRDVQLTLLQPVRAEEMQENNFDSQINSDTIRNIQDRVESTTYMEHSDMGLNAEYLLSFNDSNIKEIIPYDRNSEFVSSAEIQSEYIEVTPHISNHDNKKLGTGDVNTETVIDNQSKEHATVSSKPNESQADSASKPLFTASPAHDVAASTVCSAPVMSQSILSQSETQVTTRTSTESNVTYLDVVPQTDASRVLLPIAQLNDGSFAIIIKPFAKGVAQMKTAKSILKPIRADQNTTVATTLPTSTQQFSSQSQISVTSQSDTCVHELNTSQDSQRIASVSGDRPQVTVVKTTDAEGTRLGKLAVGRQISKQESRDQVQKLILSKF